MHNQVSRVIILFTIVHAATARASTPRNIGFTTAAQSIAVNVCSSAVQVQTQDYAFKPANVTSNTTLTPSGSFTFYSDSACAHSITSVTVLANTSSANFYFIAGATGSPTMQVSGGGLNPASQIETITSTGSTCSSPPPPVILPSPPPPPPTPCTDCTYPASAQGHWMTEAQEVAWMNSLGFSTTVSALQSSYSKFTPTTIPSNYDIQHNSESDDLRNYYRLCKRTNNAGFCQQASNWRDFYVNTYSLLNGTNSNIGLEHIYLMGLIEWYIDHPTESDTSAAISRIIDYIIANVAGPFYETRVHARAILCLAYYLERIGTYRTSDVQTKLNALLTDLDNAPNVNGFLAMPKIYDETCYSVDGMPGSFNLTSLFPNDFSQGIVCDSLHYKRGGGAKGVFPAVASYQDMIMIHALLVAGRVLNRPALVTRAQTMQNAWLPMVGHSFWDTAQNEALVMPYLMITNAVEPGLYIQRNGSSTPLYTTQYSAYCPDVNMRKALQQQALLRQYGEYTKVSETEVTGVAPKYYLWQTWEQGYFLTQN